MTVMGVDAQILCAGDGFTRSGIFSETGTGMEFGMIEDGGARNAGRIGARKNNALKTLLEHRKRTQGLRIGDKNGGR